ncbi:MAG: SdrD B-like domain-containing protein [Paracoccaceae bacterium]|nr:SdrD B-like domain-containing protein [Paracoccaceae bacterium]
MTNNMQTFEFTAFAVTDLGVGSRVNKGESFTMPGGATVCVEVTDNDSFLSGDTRHNENSNDGYGQSASILGDDGQELGNGHQIYAESYHWVTDQHGNSYVMIEIEQEGSSVDYVTFYTGGHYTVPPEGAELTVGSQCNVSGNWVDFKCLDAGEKPADDPWEFNDDTCTYTVEAESWDLNGFKVVHGDQASGGELVKLSGHDGKISTDFGGTDGVYNMTICAQDECDGNSKLMVYVNGELQQTIRLDQNTDGGGSDNGVFSEVTLQGLEIAEGDTVEIRAWRDDGEFVRIDAIKFEQVKFEVCDDPDAIKLGFDEFSAGDILGTQIDGVTISAMGGSGDAMIFDSQNPTGGDGDLETQVAQLGNVLIVSEDGDSSDPDDAIGGKITFDFDTPSSVFDLKVIDTEEGGTITLTLADGSTETFDIPNLVNGGVGQVVMDVDNVVSMDVQLNGSGAIDDLCYVPGVEPLGSLSGRYFFDTNRDGLDNDASNAIAGVDVALLDENGDPVLDGGTPVTTTTDADGNYSFADLPAGTYGVKFTDTVSGAALVEANVGGDDTIDSDAIDLNNGMSEITGIVVNAGADTPDNDAGVEDPGTAALEGRYFCDENFDDVDNNEPGIANATVTLLDATGNPVIVNGNPVTTTTDSSGNYAFTGLLAGTYGVLFAADAEGKTFVAQNDPDGNGDDTNDSDVDDNGVILGITLEIGETSSDNDAGVEDPGTAALGDKVFIDANGNGQQDVGEVGIDGVEVTLFDADGNVAGTTSTANGGMYLFDGLRAGDYTVGFEEVDSFDFTVADTGPDVTDSDANQQTGRTDTITLDIGEVNLTVDAGIVAENNTPEPQDDAGITCADDEVTVDVLANDGTADGLGNIVDADGDILSITEVDGQAISEGNSVTTGAGTVVTLVGGQLVFDGEAAYAALDITESAVENISYTVDDGQGGTATANVEMTFKGDANSVASLSESLPSSVVSYQIADGFAGSAPFGDFGYDIRITDAGGDARFEGVVFEQAYCLDLFDPAAGARLLDDSPISTADLFGANEAEAASVFENNKVGINGETAADNLDLINYILNQDYENDGTGSVDGNFTGWEVQFAIWELTNGISSDVTFDVAPEIGQIDDVDFIISQALANGEGFEAGVGDILGVILDPNPATSTNAQPFIIGINFEDYDCIC